MPHGYGYGNARLRAMRSRLFSRADYDDLLARADIEELISSLVKTPYQKDIETALIRVGKNRCVIEAVRLNFTRTLNQIRGFFEGRPLALIDLLTVKETRFFRQPEAFDCVADYVETLLRHGPAPSELSFWSAGCSSGQEAYSIGMLIEQAGGREEM